MVEFAANGRTTGGYLATPASGSGPGVIVIQEWWGLVQHVKDVAERFASEGFVALAPDLYHGRSTTSPDEAGKLMMALEIDRAERDLRGAIDFLLARDDVAGDRVGTVGFCMGGQLSLFAACANPKVGACVDFYGIHPSVTPDLANLQAPVLGFFAERDGFVTPEAARKLESDLRAAGKEVEMTVFAGPTTPSSTTPAPRCITPATRPSAGRGRSPSTGGTWLEAAAADSARRRPTMPGRFVR